jgi:eukaryotic-like serine/threonine-protein kinase
MSELASARLAAALNDRYRIERELGQGGMATVYLAHDIRHERDVAIKVLHPDLGAALGGERFLTEIRTTARLQHPHILPLLDSGSADGLLYYVMPLVTGETLRARLEREKQLPLDDAVRIARETADALGYAHGIGIIHRDIKPENILLQNNHAVVADFGIALAVQHAGGSRMTQTGLSLGTPQYMSPEQAMGEKTIDARSDIYALGAVTYEMLVGEPPFTGATVQSIVAKVLTERPVAPRALRDTVPVHIENAVLKALAKLPADRFESAGRFGEALSSAAFTHSHTQTSAHDTRRARRAVPMLAFVATTVVLGGIAIAATTWGLRRPSAAPLLRTRFTIEFPDSQPAIATYGRGNLAVSPDGTELVYGGLGRDGMVLFRRRLNDFAVSEVPGTLNPGAVRYSHDGRSLLMETLGEGTVLRVPLDGGRPVRLAERGGGASWDAGEEIVFVQKGSLWRVGSDGIAPTRMTTAADSLQTPTFPHVLPGGRTLLFNIGRQVWRLNMIDGSLARLELDGVNPRYISTGHILLTGADGAVMAVPFDLRSMEVRGIAVPVLENGSRASNGATRFDVSSNGVLVYYEGSRSASPALIGPDGKEKSLGFAGEQYFHPRISPDGERIAVERRDDDRVDVYVLTRGTRQALRLTRDGRSRSPEWSSDGERVLWITEDSSESTALHQQHADGSGAPETISTPSKQFLHRFSMSPVGNTIALATGPRQRHDIVLLSLTGASPARIVGTPTSDEVQPVMSPDGNWLAYTSNETDGRYEVYIASIANPATRIQVSTHGANAPVWRADGKTLVYSTGSHFVSATFSFAPRIEVLRRDTLFLNSYRAGALDRVFDLNSKTGEILVLSSGARARARLVIVTGWFEELKERMAQVAKR